MNNTIPPVDPADQSRRLSTGIEGLDEVLNGGFPVNRLYLIDGEPGTGKTTLALQFLMEGVRRGESVLYVTLSETKEEMFAVIRSHGWSHEGLNIYELVPGEDIVKPEEQYTIFHPSELELGDTTRAVLEGVERIKPTRVVFDSLSEMRLLARDPLRYRRQILGLKQFFAGRQCTVLLLDDRTSSVGDLQIHSLAHGVLTLEHLALEYGAERRRLRITKVRGSKFRGGYHDYKILTGGVVVYPRLVAAESRQTVSAELLSSGLPALDKLLGGGLKMGTSTLVMGPAGCGKSSITMQAAISAVKRGQRVAVYLFDEGMDIYKTRGIGLGMDIQSCLDSELLKIRQVDPAELSPGEFSHILRTEVEREETDMVVIDSLTGYLQSMPEESFLTSQMHELLTYLNQHGIVTMLVLAQYGLMGSQMASPVDVSYLADNVLLLRHFEAAGAIRKAISVVKRRVGPHETTIRELSLSNKGVVIGAPLTDFHGVLTGVPTYTGKSESLAREG